MQRSVAIEDFGRIAWPLEPALSPDGSQLAYVVSRPDVGRDRIAYDVLVGSVKERRFTRVADGRTRKPVWSPSGTQLGYLKETVSGWQLATTKRSNVMSNLPGAVSCFDWLSGGDALVVLEGSDGDAALSILDVDSMKQMQVLTLDSATPRLLASSPESDTIAVAATASDTRRSQVLMWTPGSETPHLVWAWDGPVYSLSWNPDGNQLAVLVNRMAPGLWANNELWVVDADRGNHFRLGSDLDVSVGQTVRGDDERGLTPGRIDWTVDGRGICSVIAHGGKGVLGVFGLDGSVETVKAGDGSILDYSISKRSGDLVISWSSPTSPGELSLVQGGTERQLTAINSKWLAEVELADTQLLELDGGLQGWLTTPKLDLPDGSRLIVQVHGGPHYPVGDRFSFDSQRFAAQGLSTLRSNPRGSQGYGEEYAAAIIGDWGGVDLDDVLAMTDKALKTDVVASDRVAIIGESYGGYLANRAVTASDRYDVSVSENGITDLTSIAEGPRGEEFWHPEMGGPPSQAPDLYRERSPITSVDKVRASILLIHAEDDENVPVSQSRRFAASLSEAGIDVTFEIVPDEGHMLNVFGKPSTRIARTKILDSYLKSRLEQTGADRE